MVEPLPTWARVLLIVGVAAAVFVAAIVWWAGDGMREVGIIEAVARTETELGLSISACNAARNDVDVVETDEEVVITVTSSDAPGGDDCADGVEVELGAPLGSQTLIDGSNGDRLVCGHELEGRDRRCSRVNAP